MLEWKVLSFSSDQSGDRIVSQNSHLIRHPSSPWNVALAVLDSGYDHESALPLHGLGELSLGSWKGAGALLVSDTFDWCRVEVCTYMKHEKMKKTDGEAAVLTPVLHLSYRNMTWHTFFQQCFGPLMTVKVIAYSALQLQEACGWSKWVWKDEV